MNLHEITSVAWFLGYIKSSLILESQLLDCGLVTEATCVNDKILDLGKYEKWENIPKEEYDDIERYEDIIRRTESTYCDCYRKLFKVSYFGDVFDTVIVLSSCVCKILEDSDATFSLTKNTESLRNQLGARTLKAIKPTRNCIHCKCALVKVQHVNSKFIMTYKDHDEVVSKQMNSREIRYFQKPHGYFFLL